MLYKTGNSTYPSNATQLGNADIRASKTVYDTAGNNFYYCYNQATDEFAIGARTISNSAAYAVTCTPNWNTSCWVTSKTTTGFTLNYTLTAAAQTADWIVVD